VDTGIVLDPGAQPDKILYERAVREIERGRYDVGRLTLQTLINTYPDSEYLAKAKLAIADSYYKEGGVSGFTQAEAEYKDFITFFPTAPEAPEAQYRAGLAHFRLMGKADRDRTEARLAELELKEFVLRYPDSPFLPRVKARLRQVQEVLAQGEYKVARFYYTKGALPAARSRFQEIVERYPNFSEADKALWYLGQTLERMRGPQKAVLYYARIVTEHPLSPLAERAKERLTAMNQPIPRPTRAMLARAEADAANRPRRDFFSKLGAMMSSAPDTSATRRGPVRLGQPPPSETEVVSASAGAIPAAEASIVVRPVSDADLKAGQPVNENAVKSNPGADKGEVSGAAAVDAANSGAAEASSTARSNSASEGEKSKAQEDSGKPASDNPPTNPSASKNKKKGRLRFLKKIVKPF